MRHVPRLLSLVLPGIACSFLHSCQRREYVAENVAIGEALSWAKKQESSIKFVVIAPKEATVSGRFVAKDVPAVLASALRSAGLRVETADGMVIASDSKLHRSVVDWRDAPQLRLIDTTDVRTYVEDWIEVGTQPELARSVADSVRFSKGTRVIYVRAGGRVSTYMYGRVLVGIYDAPVRIVNGTVHVGDTERSTGR